MHTQQTKDKIRNRLYGNKNAKGIIPSPETREKIRQSKLGNKNPNFGKPAWNKGKQMNKEWREKLSRSRIGKCCGKENHAWKGGTVRLLKSIRESFKYRQWRSDIYSRDGFICQKCYSNQSGTLNAHHIKSIAKIVHENKIKTLNEAYKCEELWNLNNGITLCRRCHEKTDNYGNQAFLE